MLAVITNIVNKQELTQIPKILKNKKNFVENPPFKLSPQQKKSIIMTSDNTKIHTQKPKKNIIMLKFNELTKKTTAKYQWI